MKKNIVTIAISTMIVLLVTAVVIVIANEDRTGPVITLNIPTGREITYTSGQDKQKLKQYATALDNKDGDVSDSIMIEDTYVSSDLTTIKVVYVARDKSKNITKLNQVFKYIPSKEEIDNLKKLSENATSDSNAATVSATVTSSTKEQETTKATTAAAKPVLTLTQSEATITQGDNFNVVTYIKDVTDDKDIRSTLFTRIIVSGNYDSKTAGDYPISIYCTDSEGNTSNTEKFTLHVKAKPVETQAQAQIEPTTEATKETPKETIKESTAEAPSTIQP